MRRLEIKISISFGAPESAPDLATALRSPFADWFESRCIVQEGSRELSADLYGDYKVWVGPHGRSMSIVAFGNALRDRGVTQHGKSAAGQKFRGPIRLRPQDPPAQVVDFPSRPA